MPAWSENDELFKSELLKGRKWEEYVYKRITGWGLDAGIGRLIVRDNIAEAKDFKDQVDITVYGYTLEVKSRGARFTSPEDFPFDDIMIDTVSGVDSREKPADIYVCVSQFTQRMIALPVASTREHWDSIRRWDHVRSIHDQFYVAHRDLWKDELWLRWALTRACAFKLRELSAP